MPDLTYEDLQAGFDLAFEYSSFRYDLFKFWLNELGLNRVPVDVCVEAFQVRMANAPITNVLK